MIRNINIVISIFSLILLLGCGESRKKISDAEKRIIELANNTYVVIGQIEEAELEYADKKFSKSWKSAYDEKRNQINSLLGELNANIKEARFFEQLPEEKLKEKVKIYLHAAENIKLYITTTNADLTKYFSDAPPARDKYNWDRYIIPASNGLSKIISKSDITKKSDEKSSRSKTDQGGRYFLHGPGPEATNKQIQSAPAQSETWREAVESTEKNVQKK